MAFLHRVPFVGDLVGRLTGAADELGVTVRIVPEAEWTHGEAKGICEQLSPANVQPLVEVRDRENDADLARALIHEYAHGLLHFHVEMTPSGRNPKSRPKPSPTSSGGAVGWTPAGRRST